MRTVLLISLFLSTLALVLLTTLALLTTDAQAETYHWVTEDGTVSFTDDEKHIPARYHDAAIEVDLKTMEVLRPRGPTPGRCRWRTSEAPCCRVGCRTAR